MSAALLGWASVGAVAQPVGALLRALGAPEPEPLRAAAAVTLALGHTSGAATVGELDAIDNCGRRC